MPAVRYPGESAGYVERCQDAGRHPGCPFTLPVSFPCSFHTSGPPVRTGSQSEPASPQRFRLQCNILPFFLFLFKIASCQELKLLKYSSKYFPKALPAGCRGFRLPLRSRFKEDFPSYYGWNSL